MENKLPPIPQEYFDDNRERFGAESYSLDIKAFKDRCSHDEVTRISSQEVKCLKCHMGWIDQGHFILEQNHIIGIK